jgi:hypothetical protein
MESVRQIVTLEQLAPPISTFNRINFLISAVTAGLTMENPSWLSPLGLKHQVQRLN